MSIDFSVPQRKPWSFSTRGPEESANAFVKVMSAGSDLYKLKFIKGVPWLNTLWVDIVANWSPQFPDKRLQLRAVVISMVYMLKGGGGDVYVNVCEWKFGNTSCLINF